MAVNVDGGGRKDDSDKPRWELVPPEITALVDLFTAGAKKYGDRNWERGMSYGRIFGALMRHAWKWMAGEEYDPETGAHHMVAVAWNALVLFVYTSRGVGTDDRNLRKVAEANQPQSKAPPPQTEQIREGTRATAIYSPRYPDPTANRRPIVTLSNYEGD